MSAANLKGQLAVICPSSAPYLSSSEPRYGSESSSMALKGLESMICQEEIVAVRLWSHHWLILS